MGNQEFSNSTDEEYDHWILHPSDILVWHGEFHIEVEDIPFKNRISIRQEIDNDKIETTM